VIVKFQGRRPSLRAAIPASDPTIPELVLDASELTWASPMDLTGLAAWACVGDPQTTTLILPQAPGPAAYLSRIDALDVVRESGVTMHGVIPTGERADLSDRLIEVRHMRTEADGRRFDSDVFSLVNKTAGDRAARYVLALLGELSENAFRHSCTSVGVFGSAQIYTGATTSRPGIEISISDAGKGILASLQENPHHASLSRCAQAVGASLQPGVTADVDDSGNDEVGHGGGLPRVIERLRVHRGRLVLRSGDGMARVASRARVMATPIAVPGTWSWIRLDIRDGQLVA
jgi:hypothetical protein